MLAGTLLCASALALLLAAEWRGWSRLRVAAKPVASAGFLVAALASGATGTGYGRIILCGLLLSWLGDALLLGGGKLFAAGLGIFLLAHLAYSGAFLTAGIDAATAAAAGLLLAFVAWRVWRWLRPNVPPKLRAAVAAYVVALSGMLALAAAAGWRNHSAPVAAGALAFYLSDLAVARNRFVAPGAVNRYWGLPLYYAGQLLLASTVASI